MTRCDFCNGQVLPTESWAPDEGLTSEWRCLQCNREHHARMPEATRQQLTWEASRTRVRKPSFRGVSL